MADKMPKLFTDNQKGQAVTELALMMVFLAVVLLGMVLVSGFASENISAIEKLRFEMRLSMYRNAGGPFTKNFKEKIVMINIPGRMKQVFNTPFLRQEHRLEFYEGSYADAGRGNSYYVLRDLYRKIELQD